MEAKEAEPVLGLGRRRIGPRELKHHKQDGWVAIHGQVYALGDFDDHPGGIDVLRYEAGRDATQIFEEIGHSRAAKRAMIKFDIGVFVSEDPQDDNTASTTTTMMESFASSSSSNSIVVSNSRSKVEPDASEEVGLKPSNGVAVESQISHTASNAPQSNSAGTAACSPIVAKGSRPPAPVFQQDVLRGEIHRRPKQPLKPGHSAMDWLRKQQAMPQRPSRRWKMSEVAQHHTPNDLWLILHGLVYDVTPYLYFHPGGVEELLRGAGRDATSLFESTHPWVNINALLMKCCIGALDADP